MNEIKIEKGVPIPNDNRGHRKGEHSYPFKDMEVGDCFFVDIPEKYMNGKHNIIQSSIATNARLWKNFSNNLTWRFTTRKVENKIEVWRVE